MSSSLKKDAGDSVEDSQEEETETQADIKFPVPLRQANYPIYLVEPFSG